MNPDDILLRDNKMPPKSVVAIHSPKQLFIRLGLLIDISKSEGQSGVYQPAVRGVSDFLTDTLKGTEDRVFFTSFAATLKGTEFMMKDRIANLVSSDSAVSPEPGTALFDAIYVACKERLQDSIQPARRVLVVITDGGDNASRVTHEGAIAAAQEAGAVIFVVGTSERADDKLDGSRLEEFAKKTGGRAFLHLSPKDIPKVFSSITEQVDNMWTVTFVPADVIQPGYHSIQLKPTADKKTKLRAPEGYYVSLGKK